ncbi:uncharacterized protein [Oscarella lobularis]|uniref:uncharacterized protein isoform X2 n=1 Tax=Oscarella lobularis TaxID=121494 RepID=UPI00331309C6
MTPLLSDAALRRLDAFLKNVPDEFCRSLTMSNYSRIREQMEIDSGAESRDDPSRNRLWYSFEGFFLGCKGMLKEVRSSDRKVKESFLLALHLYRPDLLQSIGATLPQEVSLAAKDEYVQLGGFNYRKHALGPRLNKFLDKMLLEKSRIGMVFIGRHVLTFIDQLFTIPHWDKVRPYSFRNEAKDSSSSLFDPTVYGSVEVFGVSVANGFREATLAFAGRTDKAGFRQAALACFEKMKKLAGVQFDVVAFLEEDRSLKQYRSFFKVLAEEFGNDVLQRCCFGRDPSSADRGFIVWPRLDADDKLETADEERIQAVATFEMFRFFWHPFTNVLHVTIFWRLGFWIGVLEICASQVFTVSDMPLLRRNCDPATIYAEAVIAGSVVVNRCRVLVVGKDGSGKSCLVDSLLYKLFQADRPSTIGAAVSLAVTSTHRWEQVESKDAQHLEGYIADGLARTDQQCLAASSQLSEDETPFENLRKVGGFAGRESFSGQSKSNQTDSGSASKAECKDTAEATFTAKIKSIKTQQTKLLCHPHEERERCSRLYGASQNTKHIWDLGGQEAYLTMHTALMPDDAKHMAAVYIIVSDISRPLHDPAQSLFRNKDGSITDLTSELGRSIETNADFPRRWLTAIEIAHPTSKSKPKGYFGENKGVDYPPVFSVFTHADVVKGRDAFVKEQCKAFAEIVEARNYVSHVILPDADAGNLVYLVDNTKSGRCESIQAIQREIDDMSIAYWKNQSPMPLRWLVLERVLVTWKDEKIIAVSKIIAIAQHACKIPSEEEAFVALKFLHHLGVIFFFWKVEALADRVFVDPEWLVKTLASFVTARRPPVPKLFPAWKECCATGKMSLDLAVWLLAAAGVNRSDQTSVFHVLQMLDVAYLDATSIDIEPTLFVPCKIRVEARGSPMWFDYNPDRFLPPPLIIIAKNVSAIPEQLYFRLVTRCLRNYPTQPILSRNQCVFHLGGNVQLELLFHGKGEFIVATLNVVAPPDASPTVINFKASSFHAFLLYHLNEAKQLGMKGLDYSICCQLGMTLGDRTNWVCIDEYDPAKSFHDQVLVDRSRCGVSSHFVSHMDKWFSDKKQKVVTGALLEDVNTKVADRHLRAVYLKIKEFWQRVARFLGPVELREYEIESLKREERLAEEQSIKMLQLWLRKQRGNAVLSDLVSGLIRADLKEVAEEEFGNLVVVKCSDRMSLRNAETVKLHDRWCTLL